jgi:Family of unknown function (DUF6114)
VIGYKPGSGTKRVEKRPTGASLGESLAHARHAFRTWRRTRPFWGGLLIIVGASELLASEQAPLPVVTHIGIQGLGGYLIPGFITVSEQAPLPVVTSIGIQGPGGYLIPRFMLICGLLLWLTPIARGFHSLLAISLALGSWITSNLGGFFIGMLIGVVGGALAFAWTTDADYRSPGRLRGRPWIGLRSWALDVTFRLKERAGGLRAMCIRLSFPGKGPDAGRRTRQPRPPRGATAHRETITRLRREMEEFIRHPRIYEDHPRRLIYRARAEYRGTRKALRSHAANPIRAARIRRQRSDEQGRR